MPDPDPVPVKSLRRLIFGFLASACLGMGVLALLFACLFPAGWERLRAERDAVARLQGQPAVARDFGLVLTLPEQAGPFLTLLAACLLCVGIGAILLGRYVGQMLDELQSVSAHLQAGSRLPSPRSQELVACYAGLQALAEQLLERQNRLTTRQSELQEENAALARVLVTLAQELRPGVRELREMGGDPANCQTLDQLLSDLEEAAQLETQQVLLQRQGVDLAGCVRDCLAQVQPLIERGALRLEADLPSSAVAVQADPAKLRRVFLNLLSNAVKFSPRGSTLSVSVHKHIVRIADAGPGIPEEIVADAGEGFVVGGEELRRRHGGSGLGLAICRQLVALHGGELEFSNREGGGTVATVSLPSGNHGDA